MNIKQYLDNKKVRTFSMNGMVTDVRELLEGGDVCIMGSIFIRDILGIDKVFDDEIYARICIKKLVVDLYNNNFEIDISSKFMLENVVEYADRFVMNPEWSFLKKVDGDGLDADGNVIERIEVKQLVVEGIDTKVAMKTDSSGNLKIKKGGKKVLAIEMYRKYVVDAIEPMLHSDFIKLMIKELDLTLAGSNTYGWNLKAGKWS